jgi:hypothetical protein
VADAVIEAYTTIPRVKGSIAKTYPHIPQSLV